MCQLLYTWDKISKNLNVCTWVANSKQLLFPWHYFFSAVSVFRRHCLVSCQFGIPSKIQDVSSVTLCSSSSSARCCVPFLFTVLQLRVRFNKGTNFHVFLPFVLLSFYLQVFSSAVRNLHHETASVDAWYCLKFGLSK